MACSYQPPEHLKESFGDWDSCIHSVDLHEPPGGLCAFHALRQGNKKKAFTEDLTEYMEWVEQNSIVKFYDFRGFIWPDVNLSNLTFKKPVRFNGGQFKGTASFHRVDFDETSLFLGCHFEQTARFIECDFKGKTDLEGAQFDKDLDFYDCRINRFNFDQVTCKGRLSVSA